MKEKADLILPFHQSPHISRALSVSQEPVEGRQHRFGVPFGTRFDKPPFNGPGVPSSIAVDKETGKLVFAYATDRRPDISESRARLPGTEGSLNQVGDKESKNVAERKDCAEHD